MPNLAFDTAHMLAGSLVLVSFMLLYQDRLTALLNVYALHALVLALSLVTAVNGFSNIGIVEFSRELRFDVQFKIQLVPTLLQIVTTLGIAWLTRSYWALLAGLAVSRISRTVITYIIHPYRPRLSLHGWRQLIGFSFWLWLCTLRSLLAVWHLGVEGAVATAVYGLVLLALWLAWGRPDGPEQTILGLLREFIPARIVQRARRILPQ